MGTPGRARPGQDWGDGGREVRGVVRGVVKVGWARISQGYMEWGQAGQGWEGEGMVKVGPGQGFSREGEVGAGQARGVGWRVGPGQTRVSQQGHYCLSASGNAEILQQVKDTAALQTVGQPLATVWLYFHGRTHQCRTRYEAQGYNVTPA